MIDCAAAVRQLWEYLEHSLDPNDRERIDEHLAFCRRCCGEMEFADELRRFMRNASRIDLPPVVEARFDRFLRGLETEGAP